MNYDATSFPIIKDAEWIQMIIVLCEQNPEIKTIKITKTENINKGIQGNVYNNNTRQSWQYIWKYREKEYNWIGEEQAEEKKKQDALKKEAVSDIGKWCLDIRATILYTGYIFLELF